MLTPCLRLSQRTDGTRSPGRKTPRSICSSIWRAIFKYSGGLTTARLRIDFKNTTVLVTLQQICICTYTRQVLTIKLLEPALTPKLKAREFQFVNRLTSAQIEQLWSMSQAEWWSRGRNLNDIRRAVEHSSLICAYCDPATGRLAAFARVLTDFVYKAVIFDVIVDRPHRRRGLG